MWGYPPPPYPGMYVSAHCAVLCGGAKAVHDTPIKNAHSNFRELKIKNTNHEREEEKVMKAARLIHKIIYVHIKGRE